MARSGKASFLLALLGCYFAHAEKTDRDFAFARGCLLCSGCNAVRAEEATAVLNMLILHRRVGAERSDRSFWVAEVASEPR
jgi:hypothetical protein